MRTAVCRIVSMCLAVLLACSGIITGTFCWQSTGQNAKNELHRTLEQLSVELVKREKLPDGTATQRAVPGAAFYLYREDGTQQGVRYVTDEDGKISLRLAAGSYYFEESAPPAGYTFDTDAEGQQVTRYPFTVTGDETDTILVAAYNVRLQGALTVQKIAENADGSPLTDAQMQREFTFAVTFSDGGTYSYSVDGGPLLELTSGGTLTLCHGQTAVFQDIPTGVSYTVAELGAASRSNSLDDVYAVGNDAHLGAAFIPAESIAAAADDAVDNTADDTDYAFADDAGDGESSGSTTDDAAAASAISPLSLIDSADAASADSMDTDRTGSAGGLSYGERVQESINNDLAVQLLQNYTVSSSGSQGTITADGCTARFVNTFSDGVSASLRIEKTVAGDGADLDREFVFEAVIGGVHHTFALKHGESYTFSGIPLGTAYTITEADYTAENYTPNIKSYSGTVNSEGILILPFVNTYASVERTGTLRVTKKVVGDMPDPEQLFTFAVTFSDPDVTYSYSIDGGEPIASDSPAITFRLKAGQTAEFVAPEGVAYVVKETDPAGYLQDVGEAGGTIVGDTAYVIFLNRVPGGTDEPAALRVTKVLAGEYPAADADRAFHFTLFINGVAQGQGFDLKNGESAEFTVPAGAAYEVREDDYFADNYTLTLTNGAGTAQAGQAIEAVATNTYTGEVQVELKGEKTWDMNGQTAELPESITVFLKDGTRTAAEQVVRADENGRWIYTFTAPKYDAGGSEIAYSVEEAPVAGFAPSYAGMNITNTCILPVEVDPPIIQKIVEGDDAPETQFRFLLRADRADSPMPAGSQGNQKTVSIDGSGTAELGTFRFSASGTYSYTISEIDDGAGGWTYDRSVYTLTFTVEESNGTLSVQRSLTKANEAADTCVFTNRYEKSQDENVVVSGTKTWHHGSNTNLPDSITVCVYGDGVLAAQRLVTANDGWQYSFTLPRFAADGHEIVYTVDEVDVPNYTKTINGYDIANTYQPQITPDEPGNTPKTGDAMNLRLWIMASLLSGGGLAVAAMARRKHSRNGHRPER